jgi:uncharacterized membrane protein YgcG
MLFAAILSLARADEANDQINATVDAAPANISQIREKLIIDYTNTILYQVTWASVTTLSPVVVGGVQTATVSVYHSLIALFVQTLFHVKKLVEVTPAPTDWQQLPPPTESLRYFFFGPYFLCLATFAVVFLGGALWTYRCKKTIRVLAPTAVTRDLSDSDLDDVSTSGRGSKRSSGSGRGRSGSARSGRSGAGRSGRGKAPAKAAVKSRAAAKGSSRRKPRV